MKKQIAAALLAMGVMSFSAVTLAADAAPAAAPAAPAAAAAKGIEGTLTKIEGEYYFVKDKAGKEVKGHFNASTKKVGDIKAGAMVEIYIDDKGHTTEIKEHKH